MDEISDVKQIGDTYYLIKPVKRIKPEIQPFESVEQEVRADLTSRLRKEAAEKQAEKILESLKKRKSMKSAAGKAGLELKTTGLFTRDGEIDGIQNFAKISDAAFKLTKDQKVCPEVLNTGNLYYVIELVQKKVPDAPATGRKMEEVKESVVSKKEQQLYGDWLESLKSRYPVKIKSGILDG